MEQTFDFELDVNTEDVLFEVENNPDNVEVDVSPTEQLNEVDGGAVLVIDNHKDLKGRDLPNQHPISAITGLETALNGKQAVIPDLEEIRQGAEKGESAVQPDDVPVKDVQTNGTSIVKDGVANIPIAAAGGKLGLVFPAGFGIGVTTTGALAINKATDELLSAKTNNFQPVVPSNLDSAVKVGVTTNENALTDTEKENACSWLGALPDTTKYGSSLSLTINEQTYILTAQLKDQNGDNLGTAQTVDLPLETMVVGAEYDETTKEVVLTLKNGQTVRFSIADLVSGLQPTIPDLSAIRTGAEKGATAVQPNQLSAVATSGSYNDLNNKPTIPTQTSQLTNNSDFTTKAYVDGLVGDIETALNNINSGG